MDTRTKLAGMGAILHDEGVAFRVWAPNAETVAVVGDFNNWEHERNVMEREGEGYWYADVPGAKVGDEYQFAIRRGEQSLLRNDPYAREMTNSAGNSVIADTAFDWGEDAFTLANHNELVIYEMHVGTFHRETADQVGTFDGVRKKLDYLKWLGVNAIQIMPSAEFAGDLSWGYNPAHIFAVESAYGGPVGLKQLVKAAHEAGIGVIMDVVYNHFGPSDLDLWQFDGWSENGQGGIYFYNDWRAETPWGQTRPDYGRGEVRQFIRDNAMMWIDEFHMDGLRFDMTLFIRSVDGSDERSIPEGWTLAQWINRDVRSRSGNKITIAEDLRTNPAITADESYGGANFSSQWDEQVVHPLRQVVTALDDGQRDMESVSRALQYRYNLDAFGRVVYSESHDEVANGKKRVPSEIHEQDPDGWHARRRSSLAAVMVFTAPGIPMIFQGQEFLEDGWFQDSDPIDWQAAGEEDEVMRLYRDLIALRLNRTGQTTGLTGQHIEVRHVNHLDQVVAFRRWMHGGPGDETIVVANFSHRDWSDYRIGFPGQGAWQVRFDSSSSYYAGDFEGAGISEVLVSDQPYDNYPHSGSFPLRPYSALILSMDRSQVA